MSQEEKTRWSLAEKEIMATQNTSVFLSHSTRDEEFLCRLKGLLIEKTHGTVKFFLSSDGQSIPLGRNWVFSTEQALKKSKLMFVFLSPQSIYSNWIHFEAGFAYRQDIRVVPIGILGLNLEKVAPPLSLLQGFNITSSQGVENIVAVINETHNHKHPTNITDEEFNKLLCGYETQEQKLIGEFGSLIEEIRIDSPFKPVSDLTLLSSYLSGHNLEHNLVEDGIIMPGLKFRLTPDEELEVLLEQMMLSKNLKIVSEYFKLRAFDTSPTYILTVAFVESVDCCQPLYKALAKLYQSGIKYKPDGTFQYQTISFKLIHRGFSRTPIAFAAKAGNKLRHDRWLLEIRCSNAELADLKLLELLKVLFEREMLFVEA